MQIDAKELQRRLNSQKNLMNSGVFGDKEKDSAVSLNQY